MKKLLTIVALVAVFVFAGLAQGGEVRRGMRHSQAVAPRVVPSLRAITKNLETRSALEATDGMQAREEMSNMTEAEEEALREQPLPPATGKVTIDPSAPTGQNGAQSPQSITAPILSTNFEGNLQGGSRPGDLMVAVGPHNIVSTANSTVRIRDRAGNVQLTASALAFLGANYGGFDPKVTFDVVAQRFIMLFDDNDAISGTTNATYYVGVSQTDDAMGGWYIYSFNMQYDGDSLTTNWADFPGLGFDNNCIYMTGNMYSGNSFHYVKTRVVDKNAMYLGFPVNYVDILDVPGIGTHFTMKPAQSLSSTNIEYLLVNPNGGGSRIQIYRITGGPSSPVLENVGNPTTSSYGIPPKGVQKDCAGTPVDAGDARTQEPVFRDGYLYLANQVGVTINSTNVCAIRYYKIDPVTATVLQEETYGAQDNYYLYPAVTVDAAGTVFMAFSRMSANEYASGAFTGKRITDTTFQPSTLVKAGGSAYWCLLTGQRWGDYEGVSLDPSETSDTLGAAWVDGNWAKGPSIWGSWIGKTLFYYHRIQGTVYNDCDSNSATTEDRKPILGATVILTLDTTFADTVTTDSSGHYSFGLLNDGVYTVHVVVPGGDFALDALPGSGGTAQSKIDATTLQVTLTGAATASQTSAGNDFDVVAPKAFPSATMLVPAVYSAGEPGFTLVVNGSDFEPCAFATFDGSPRATTFVNDTTVQVAILAGDIADTGSHTIRVVNPTPGGGPSNGLTFTVERPAPVFSGSPRVFSFGNVLIGGNVTDTITVTNTGTADLHITGVGSDNPEFAGTPGSATLARQTSQAFAVTYAPTALGLQTGHIIFTHDAATSPDTFSVSGTGLDSTMFRTARAADWANAFDAKNKRKSYPRKADKVFFDFLLTAPGNAAMATKLTITFNMTISSFTLYTSSAATDTVAYASRTFDAKRKVWNYNFMGVLAGGQQTRGIGIGASGKKVTVKYLWTDDAVSTKIKGSVPDASSLFQGNAPGLPEPNLINVGEELFPKSKAQPSPYFNDLNKLIVGIPTGPKGGRSVWIKKYADALKSLVDSRSGQLHTGPASCLSSLDNGSPIASQLTSLSPLKKNDILFAELLAFKLNIGASAAGKFPPGFGELTYFDSSDLGNPFNGMLLKNAVGPLDSMLSCDFNTVTDTGKAMSFLRRVNAAFRDDVNQKDTASFLQKTILVGVRPLGQVPFLRKTPGITPVVFASPDVQNNDVPQSFRLYQNYPNPFNPTTTMRFDLPSDGIVTLRIYNVLGQEVAKLIDNQSMELGVQEFEFDASRLSSGVYFYSLTVHSAPDPDAPAQQRSTLVFTDVKKMLLMK